MKKNRYRKKSDSLREGGEELRDYQWGMQRPGVPCADLTALALTHSDSVGLCDRTEVIRNDVITESGVCSLFNIHQSTENQNSIS